MRVRPPNPEDAEAVLAVVVARDVADLGRPDYTLDDIRADWSAPGIELERDCFVATDEHERIVGYALIDWRSAMICVHPAAEGRGIGTALRMAVEARARERGQPPSQTVAASNAAAIANLRAAGYERRHVYQRMRAPLEAMPAAPPDRRVRPFDLDAEGPAVHELVEQAFSEIDGNVSEPWDSWRAFVARTAPELRLVVEDDDGLGGAAIGQRWETGVGYVAIIAVAPRARGRGYGRALLLALAGAFGKLGLTSVELSVHADNAPATGLYESVGMAPDFRHERWVKRDDA